MGLGAAEFGESTGMNNMISMMKNVVVGLLVAFVVLLLIEVAARVLSTVQDDNEIRELQNWLVFSPDVGWKRRPNFTGIALKERREFDEDGYPVTSLSPLHEGKPRILLLGDSVTYGYRVHTDSTFASLLDSMLGSHAVINLGVPGYTSYQGLRTLDAAMSLDPDLVVVAFNYNDRRYVLDAGKKDGPAFFRTVSRWSKLHFLSRYYTFRAMRSVLNRVLSRGEPDVDLMTATVRVPLADYTSNLEQMTAIAGARDVPIVFLVMGDNPISTRLIRKGLALRDRQELELAKRAFQESIALGQFEDLARLELARTLESQGLETEHVATVPPSVELPGGTAIRSDGEYCDALIKAGQRLGAYVLDVRPILTEDPIVFFDNVHFGNEGHKKVAGALHDLLDSVMTDEKPDQ